MNFDIAELLTDTPATINVKTDTAVGSIYAYSENDGCIAVAYNSIAGRSWDGNVANLLYDLAEVTKNEDYSFIVSLVDTYTLSTAVVWRGEILTGNTPEAVKHATAFIQAAKYQMDNPVSNAVIGLDPEPLIDMYHRRIEAAEKIGHELARLDYLDVTDRLAALAR